MGVGPGPTSLALSPRAPLSHWGAVSSADPLGAVAGTPSLLCPPTAHTLVKHSRKSFGAIREVWSQHRLPQKASFLVVVVWGLAALVRELGALICKAEQQGCQSEAPLASLLPSLASWVGSQRRRGSSPENPGGCPLGQLWTGADGQWGSGPCPLENLIWFIH